MDGLINLYKPVGITSAKALYRVRKLTGQRKSGHAGTLDPEAEGVLLLCLGRATKLVEGLMDLSKVYRTIARLDLTSASFDSEGDVEPVAVEVVPTETDVRAALAGFEGTTAQVPPALSAVKIRGRSAYKLSRAGRPVTLAPRPVRIYWTHIYRYAWPVIEFAIACGRGTYVRALIRDLGVRLGTGGCLTSLARTAVGPFRAETAWTLDRLWMAREPGEYLVSLEEARVLIAAGAGEVPPQPAAGSGAGEIAG